jgi:hypothetical protein
LRATRSASGRRTSRRSSSGRRSGTDPLPRGRKGAGEGVPFLGEEGPLLSQPFLLCQYHHMNHPSRAQTSQGARNITAPARWTPRRRCR